MINPSDMSELYLENCQRSISELFCENPCSIINVLQVSLYNSDEANLNTVIKLKYCKNN